LSRPTTSAAVGGRRTAQPPGSLMGMGTGNAGWKPQYLVLL
jgi:hypothetical protein